MVSRSSRSGAGLSDGFGGKIRRIRWKFPEDYRDPGLDAARARGRVGGRKPKLNARQAATVRRMYQATGSDGKRQHTVAEIAEAVGVHRTTVYDYLSKER